MVRFLPFDRSDEEGISIVLKHIDFSIQYGEDLEFKEPKVRGITSHIPAHILSYPCLTLHALISSHITAHILSYPCLHYQWGIHLYTHMLDMRQCSIRKYKNIVENVFSGSYFPFFRKQMKILSTQIMMNSFKIPENYLLLHMWKHALNIFLLLSLLLCVCVYIYVSGRGSSVCMHAWK